jgi:Optic atrophy 3 protein (OPA3)
MWGMNLGRPVEIPKLNEEMAIDLGGRVLAEVIIYSITAAILVTGYVRKVKPEAEKKIEELEIEELESKLQELLTNKELLVSAELDWLKKYRKLSETKQEKPVAEDKPALSVGLHT